MSREIKFRGKRVDNGEWVYGNYIKVTPYKDNDGHRICSQDSWDMFEVDHESVGQFTGLHDMEKSEIFDGDIIDGSYTNPMTKEIVKRHYLVVFENGCFTAKLIGKSPFGDVRLYFVNEKCKVIGNIYENPEFLEGVTS